MSCKLQGALLLGMWIGALALLTLGVALPPCAVAQEPATSPTPLPAGPSTSTPTPIPSQERFEPEADVPPRMISGLQGSRDNDMRFERISIEEGLSQSAIHCVLQDRKGFMWFATEDGLNKYDGYGFAVLRHDPQNANSLSSNNVRYIHEDQGGVLWIGTWGGGLNRYDPESGLFSHYSHDPNDANTLGHDNVSCIFEDPAGVLWIGTGGGGLDRLDPQSGTFTHYRHRTWDDDSLSGNSVLTLYGDREGQLWVGTYGGGLNQLDPLQRSFVRYQNDPVDPYSLGGNDVTCIVEDDQGNLWVGTADNGLSRLDRATGRFRRYVNDPDKPRSLSSNEVRCIYRDRASVLWVGTNGGGLERYDRQSEGFIHYHADPYNPQSLGHNDVISVYEDRGGVLWIGTYGGGLSKASPANQKFAHHRHDSNDPNSLSDNRVWAICEDRTGVLWIGTYQGGLNRWDRNTGRWMQYLHDPGNPASLSSNTVRSVYEDGTGTLWIGTEAGLDRLDRASGGFVHYRHDPRDRNSLSSNRIGPILEDRSGVLWIGTVDGGLNGLNRQTGRFTRYRHDPADPTSLSSNAVSAIYQTSDKTLYVGTLGGGFDVLDPESGRFTRYQHDPNEPNSLSHDRVLCFAEDYRENLYIATWGGGLDRFDPGTGRFRHFREKDGLPNDVVYGVLEDASGYLWLSTNKGLSKFNPTSMKFRNYDVTDGLQSNEFNSGACFCSQDGELFFGGINGFNAFYPAQVKDNPHSPKMVVTAFKKLDRTMLTDIAQDTHIELSYDDNFIAFEFAALDYTAPQKNQYSYRLEGLDPQWVLAGTRRYASYTNLRGGQYVFRVRGSNNDGVWNTQGIAFYITVTPPVWESWWFRAIAGLLLVSTVVAGYRLRIAGVEQRSRELEKEVEDRTQEIERRRQELEALYGADAELHRHLRLDEVLQALVDVAVRILRADKSSVLVWDPASERWTMRVSHGFGPEVMTELAFARNEGLAGWVALTGEPATVQDAGTDPRRTMERPGVMRVVLQEGIRSFMLLPIKVDGKVFALFNVSFAEPHAFDDDGQRVFVALAQRAARAIENAQLYEQTQELAVVQERSRLARELHDAVTQTLFSASLIAEVLPSLWESDPTEGRQLLQELRQLSRGALAEMRTLLLELRPTALAEASLSDLLRQLTEAASGRTGVPVSLQLDGRPCLPEDVHVALYRIVQEALNNVVKHAQAKRVTVRLRCTPNVGEESVVPCQRVELSVSDDGRGFDPQDVPAEHLGLDIIRERAESIQADLSIQSEPGQGTQVSIVWTGPWIEPLRKGHNR